MCPFTAWLLTSSRIMIPFKILTTALTYFCFVLFGKYYFLCFLLFHSRQIVGMYLCESINEKKPSERSALSKAFLDFSDVT